MQWLPSFTLRFGRRQGRGLRGVTLVEVSLAFLIVAVALVPIFRGFRSITSSVTGTRDRTTALFLAQSILEQARFRLYAEDSRYYTLDDTEDDIRQARQDEKWKTYFLGLGHPRQAIVSTAGSEVSTYFARFENVDGSGAHGFRAESDPALVQQLARFQCEVIVRFESPDGEIIDPDGDGKVATDMAWIVVRVYWDEPGPDGAIERNIELSSLLSEMTHGRDGG